MSLVKEVEAIKDYLISTRRELHENPELSLKEFRIADRIEEELNKLGIEHRRVGETGVLGALQKALDEQANIGVVQTRLSYTSSNLTTASENVQNSESTIRDADMAKEMTNYTKNNVLLQAAQSMLAQANQNSSAILSLLQ